MKGWIWPIGGVASRRAAPAAYTAGLFFFLLRGVTIYLLGIDLLFKWFVHLQGMQMIFSLLFKIGGAAKWQVEWWSGLSSESQGPRPC